MLAVIQEEIRCDETGAELAALLVDLGGKEIHLGKPPPPEDHIGDCRVERPLVGWYKGLAEPIRCGILDTREAPKCCTGNLCCCCCWFCWGRNCLLEVCGVYRPNKRRVAHESLSPRSFASVCSEKSAVASNSRSCMDCCTS